MRKATMRDFEIKIVYNYGNGLDFKTVSAKAFNVFNAFDKVKSNLPNWEYIVEIQIKKLPKK